MDEIYTDDEEIIEAKPPKRIRFEPFEVGGKSYDSIVVGEPNAGQLLKMREHKDPIQQIVVLISLNAGIPVQAVHRLPQRVIDRASEHFASFSPPSPDPKPATGEGSSPE